VITMAKNKKIYPNPKFGSAEEENKYWATHSPLDEGYEGTIQKEKQKRSSFLTIRLTGEELTQLRDISSSRGMGPSTFIRTFIKNALTPGEQAELTLSKSGQQLQSIVQKLVSDKKAGGTLVVKDKAKEQYEVHPEAFCILQLSKACVKVITPDDVEFDEISRITHEQAGTAKK
jgi:predicted DNA binding CopG/RHH family protein